MDEQDDNTNDLGSTRARSGRASELAPEQWVRGQRMFGRYQVLAELGRGGMGIVLAARDLELGRDVALKFVRGGSNPEWSSAVRVEARALAALKSRNIVPIHDVRTHAEDFCIVMDLAHGCALDELLHQVRERRAAGAAVDGRLLTELLGEERESERDDLIEPDSWNRSVVRLMNCALVALEQAHTAGIVHRDLKPANLIIMPGGEPMLLDFGIAASSDSDSEDDEGLRGTPSYLPPEHVRSSRTSADPRGDVYQMGLILHELLALEKAIDTPVGAPLTEVLDTIKNGRITPIAASGRSVHPALTAIVARATTPNPDERYATAAALRTDLERWLSGLPPRGTEIPGRVALAMRTRYIARHPLTAVALIVALAAWAATLLAPTDVAAAKLEAFVYEKGSTAPRPITNGAQLALDDEALLGLEITTKEPLYVYAFSVFGQAEDRADQLMLPLDVEPFPPPVRDTAVPREPRGRSVAAGVSRWTCTLLSDPHAYEGMVAFVTDEPSDVMDAWLSELWVSTDGGRRPVPWPRAWEIGSELVLGRRGRALAELDEADRDAWFGALAQPQASDSELDPWAKLGLVRFEFDFGTSTSPADEPAPATLDEAVGAGLPTRTLVTEPVEEVTIPSTATSRRRALIIGIDRYGLAGKANTRGARPLLDLGGAVNDAHAFGSLLTARYGFAPDDVITLIDEQATRDAILDSFRAHLIAPAEPGDLSLFFFAGHGSEIRSAGANELERIDQTLVTADAADGARDIWDKELAALLNDVLDRGAHVTAILDSCHSGSVTRSLGRPPRARFAPADEREAREVYADVTLDDRGDPAARGAVVLAAAQGFQSALELPGPDDRVHGLFSEALVATLRQRPIDEPLARTFALVVARMSQSGHAQVPVLSGTDAARARGLFGQPNQELAGQLQLPVVNTAEGSVRVLGGTALGLGLGARLRTLDDPPQILDVLDVGLSHSTARLSQRATERGTRTSTKPDIEVGALLEVESFGRIGGEALDVWWPSQDGATAEEIELRAPTAALAEALAFTQQPDAAVRRREDRDRADYWLAARERDGRREHAWVRVARGAETSALPAATAWQPDDATGRSALRAAVLRLARLRAWLRLESPPDTGLFPYELVLRDRASGQRLDDGQVVEGQELAFSLESSHEAPLSEHRFVFLFVLQSDGSSVLLFPRRSLGGEGNRLPPRDAETPRTIPIPHPKLRVGPPFGVDTFVLLTSRTQLVDPRVLEGAAVVSATRGSDDALQRLLIDLNGPTRSHVEAPRAWSVQRLQVVSRPKD